MKHVALDWLRSTFLWLIRKSSVLRVIAIKEGPHAAERDACILRQ